MYKQSLNLKKRGSQIFIIIISTVVLSDASPILVTQIMNALSEDEIVSRGCTVFSLSKGNQSYFGGNDDYIEPDSYYWVQPSTPNSYGAIWIGFPENVQQGVNEKGLAYDANGLPKVDVASHPERQPVFGGYTSYPVQILKECASVIEVIEWVKSHTWHTYMHDQMHFADSSGDAVIISAGVDGELVFTRKSQRDGYLVSTNFNVANPDNGFSYPCWRYETAHQVLGGLLGQEGLLSPSDVASVLEAVHVDGGASWTIVSLVADLSNGVVYLYYFHQFENPIVLSVVDEIASPRVSGSVSSLFPEDVQREASFRYQRILGNVDRVNLYGKVWVGLVVVCLAVYLFFSGNVLKGRSFWVVSVFVTGPLGLLGWLVLWRGRRFGALRMVLVEAIGDIVPSVIAFLVYLVVVFFVPGASVVLQVVLVFGLPVVVGLLFFQGPLLSRSIKNGYYGVLRERFPQVWVVSNLGMAGIVGFATPMVVRNLVASWSVWVFGFYWGVVVLSGFVGVLVLTVYEYWAMSRGFLGWWVFTSGEGKVVSPSLREVWLCLFLSYLVLFCGIIVSQLLR